jgi:Ax21 family sulfation-dependent quorum factor
MKRSLLALALLAALPLAHAQASELSYSYLEAGYLNIDPKGFSSQDGWGVRGSAAVSDNFHIFGGYDNFRVRVSNARFDIDFWRIGLGYNMAISDSSDLVARVAYEDFDGDDGWSVEVGLRGALAPNFEGFVGLGYADGSDFSGEAYLALQGQYKFNRNWGLVADAKLAEDGRVFFIGPRFSF